ncbi:MAG: alpha-galactosidase [Clostridia bacterium]|nr:alpha-galactosidase [Clostridia bacterium]
MKLNVLDLKLGTNARLLNVPSVVNHDGKFNIIEVKTFISNHQKKSLPIKNCLRGFEFTGTILSVMYQESSWCNENRPIFMGKPESIHLKSKGARTSADYNPFIRLYTDKRIITLHVLAVGDWEINFEFNEHTGKHTVFAGLLSRELALELFPGEKIKLPDILIHEFPSDDEAECNREFQKYLNHRFLSGSRVPVPIVYNSWFFDFDKFFVRDLKKQVVAAKELGATVFVVDAGWYGPSNDDWSKATGDWREKKNGAFFGKMKHFAEYVRSIGLDFGLWIEAEKFCEGTPIIARKPGWFINAGEGIYYMDLMKPAAFRYLHDLISSLIKKYNVKWLKIDSNFPLADDPYKSNHYRYMQKFYELIDMLQADFPETVFEACQSGAMRADLEAMKHFDIQFLSDNVRPSDIIEIFKNSLCRTSPSLLYKWIVLRQIQNIPRYSVPLKEAGGALIVPKGATWNSFESCDIATICHLIYLGCPGFSGDISGLTDINKKMIAGHIDIYTKYFKDIPSTAVSLETDQPGWTIFEFDNEKAMLTVAFRKPGSLPGCRDMIMPEADNACSRLVIKSN